MPARPLLATIADEARYVRTAAADELRRLVGRSRNVLVVGGRGAGKTSLLHMLELGLRDERRPVYVSLAAVPDVGHAVAAIYDATGRAGLLGDRDERITEAALAPDNPFGVNWAIEALADTPPETTFLIDDPSATVGHALFGRLRDAVWGIDRTWVVAVDVAQVAALLEPPADAFFDRRLHLGDLTAAERAELIERHFGESVTSAELDRLARVLDNPFLETGNPRDLIHLVQVVTDAGDVDGKRLGAAASRRSRLAAEAVGDVASPLLRQLDAQGAVSASDPGLLGAMGWSRPRAVAVLNELVAQGVLDAYDAAPVGPGRPRKVYELRPITAFLDAP